MSRRVAALVVAAAATFASVRAEAAPRVVEVIGATADVRAIANVDDAILLGTSAGVTVVRDGGVVQTLGVGDGLVGARVLSLSATADGVWVGGADGAALLVRDGAGAGAAFRVARTQAIRRVTRVAQFAGDTWFATYGDGVLRMSPGGAPVAVAIGRDRKRVSDLVVVGDRLWIATIDDGIVRLTADGHRDEVAGLASNVVWDLEADGARARVLAATAAGVDAIPDRAGRARPLAGLESLRVRDVRALAHRGTTTWVATFGAGAWRIDGAAATPTHVDAAPQTRALALVGDHVIVGSDRGATRDGEPLLHGVDGLPSADVTALATAFGALWIGTFSHGVARLRDGDRAGDVRGLPADGSAAEWRRGVIDVPPALAAIDPRINDLAVTTDGDRETLWIATDRGVWSFDGTTLARAADADAPADEHVTALYVDPTGALWVAGARMLARHDATGWRSFTGDSDTPLAHLDAVAMDRAGHVWAAGLHGLVELVPATGERHAYSAASGALAVDWATAVIAWRDGIVVGTYDAGLSWRDAAGAIRQERDVPAGWVNAHAMRAVGDALWFGTLDRGLVVGNRGAWQRLRIADGLPSDDVTAILPAGDRAMWVGTRGGLARVTW